VSEADDRLDWPSRGLYAWQERIARAAAEALLCDEDAHGELAAPPPEVCERGVSWMNRSLGGSSSSLRAGFVALCLALELFPIVVGRGLRRMSRMALADRVAYLEALEASSVSLFPLLVLAFKIPLCMPAFEEGDELASTGFDRPSTAARRRLPMANAEGAP
jgi:hypothetical protein